MACFSPWVPSGSVGVKPMACGQCHGCRLARSREWAARCVHEASLYDENSFVTLTYREPRFSLHYPDFQLFMRRLRKEFAPRRIRFYMCGEYGEIGGRAHFHALLFNCGFRDRVLLRRTKAGSDLFRSAVLERCWPHGHSSVGNVTLQSAGYVARYVLKKLTGDGDESCYDVIDPDTGEVFKRVKEFGRMSLRPGIGAAWLRRFWSDVYPRGKVVVGGAEVSPPRYYDKLFAARGAGEWFRLSQERRLERDKYRGELLPSRLGAREAVSLARLTRLKRGSV